MHVISCCHVLSMSYSRTASYYWSRKCVAVPYLRWLHDHFSDYLKTCLAQTAGTPDIRASQHGICIDVKHRAASGMVHGEAAALSH